MSGHEQDIAALALEVFSVVLALLVFLALVGVSLWRGVHLFSAWWRHWRFGPVLVTVCDGCGEPVRLGDAGLFDHGTPGHLDCVEAWAAFDSGFRGREAVRRWRRVGAWPWSGVVPRKGGAR